jgi:hypothetical protein
MKKGRYEQAYQSLLKLRNNPIQAARDLYYIHVLLVEERKIVGDSNYVTRFIELFTIPRVRRATLASFTVMIAQQMCGSECLSSLISLSRIQLTVHSQHHCVLFLQHLRRRRSRPFDRTFSLFRLRSGQLRLCLARNLDH